MLKIVQAESCETVDGIFRVQASRGGSSQPRQEPGGAHEEASSIHSDLDSAMKDGGQRAETRFILGAQLTVAFYTVSKAGTLIL